MTNILVYLFALARTPLRGRLLDVGCGKGLIHAPLKARSRRMNAVEIVGIDAYLPYLRNVKSQGSEAIQAHASYLPFRDRVFDGVIALEVIEHLSEEEGRRMLDELERVCRGRIIVSTPKRFEEQGAGDPNPFELHRSAWAAEDFRKRGYKVRYLPERLSLFIPFIVVYRLGLFAEQIFAIKEVNYSETQRA